MKRGYFSRITYIFLVFSFFIPNFVLSAQLPTDPFMYEQWYLNQINATSAWDITTGSSDVIVALLDSGFDLDHEDLVGQFWKNKDEIDGNKKDNDNNGYEDDVYGWDFVDGDNDPSPNTEDVLNDTVISHGTILSGIIGAATNNNIGIAGINHSVSIMPLRVLDKNGSGSSANVRRAIKYAVNNGAEVINFSFTFSQSDDRLQSIIEWAYDQGVVMVSAVGNGDLNIDQNPIYPACFDTRIGKNVIIGVASSDKKDKKASFSNYGKICTDISAPGVNIFGTVYNDRDILLLSTSYGGPWEGTSVSAPMVSAAAALLKSHYPTLTPDQVRNVLKLSVDPIKELSVEAMGVLGVGRLNIHRALLMASDYTKSSGFILNKPKINTSNSFVVANTSGSSPVVKRVDDKGNVLSEFNAYHEDFKGGVRVAMGDLNNDDKIEIITGAGPGGGPQVRVFDLYGNVLDQFFAYDEDDRSGVYVEVGDIDSDGHEEIIVTQDAGGTGQVKIFDRRGKLKGSFLPFGRTGNLINVSVANVDNDPEEEIVVSSVTPDGTRVKIFDGNGRYLSELGVNKNIKNQILVSSGDIDSDGISEILISSGPGNDPMVYIYRATGEIIKSFFVYGHGFLGGVQTSVGDIDNNGISEIYVSPISDGSQHIRIFSTEGSPIGGFILDSKEKNGAFISI